MTRKQFIQELNAKLKQVLIKNRRPIAKKLNVHYNTIGNYYDGSGPAESDNYKTIIDLCKSYAKKEIKELQKAI